MTSTKLKARRDTLTAQLQNAVLEVGALNTQLREKTALVENIRGAITILDVLIKEEETPKAEEPRHEATPAESAADASRSPATETVP